MQDERIGNYQHSEHAMSSPTVCAVMLTRDRPDMAERAIRSWAKQTYENKSLMVLDTGDDSVGYLHDYDNVTHQWTDLSLQSWTIGALRNEAISPCKSDIIVTMDDDDVSHPRRIEEQVALLQSSGAQVVGYNEALFWDTRKPEPQPVKCPSGQHLCFTRADGSIVPHYSDYQSGAFCVANDSAYGEAWLYSNPFCILGASFAYWRSYWESRPFGDTNDEDTAWQQGKIGREFLGVSALATPIPGVDPPIYERCGPRLACGIHGRNSSTAYSRESMEQNEEWRRTPELDEYAERAMRL